MRHSFWDSLMWGSMCKQHEPPSKPPPKHVMFWGWPDKIFIELTSKHDMFRWELAWELVLPSCQNSHWATSKWTMHLQLIIEIMSRHYKYTKTNNQVLPLLKLSPSYNLSIRNHGSRQTNARKHIPHFIVLWTSMFDCLTLVLAIWRWPCPSWTHRQSSSMQGFVFILTLVSECHLSS
jgi:hypothetical protein